MHITVKYFFLIVNKEFYHAPKLALTFSNNLQTKNTWKFLLCAVKLMFNVLDDLEQSFVFFLMWNPFNKHREMDIRQKGTK